VPTTNATVPSATRELLPEPGLQWLVRLRWVATIGQFLTCLGVRFALDIELPWAPLLAFLALTLGTNLLAMLRPRWLPARTDAACALLLAQDTLTLTGMLWWTGGAHNPFTGFYLLHLAMAAMILPQTWTWAFLGFSTAGFSLQFFSPHEPIDPRLTTVGQVVSLALVGASIAFFVGRLRLALARREQELSRERERTVRNERFATVATLAAGVAHELATPLSTIAVVGSDFERLVEGDRVDAGLLADAQLIRSEVERCRKVLEGLSDRATSGIGDPPEGIELSSIPERLRAYLSPASWTRLLFADQEAGRIVAPAPPLLQSLAALVKNACEASPPDTAVILSVAIRHDRVRFSVSDRGHGMSPGFARRIGEPFLTTKGPGRGMGLGLFLVRTFAERVEGTLEIDSREGSGTTVHLEIPVAPAERA